MAWIVPVHVVQNTLFILQIQPQYKELTADQLISGKLCHFATFSGIIVWLSPAAFMPKTMKNHCNSPFLKYPNSYSPNLTINCIV